jgi:hypothetical protein
MDRYKDGIRKNEGKESWWVNAARLEFFTGYGSRKRPDLAITKLTSKIMAGEPTDQQGDGSKVCDYTFIASVV